MATNVVTALEIEAEHHARPVTWTEWITLPIRPQDNAVQTVRGPIRVPTAIVAVNYANVPKKRPKLCARATRERDGNRCFIHIRFLDTIKGILNFFISQVPSSESPAEEDKPHDWPERRLKGEQPKYPRQSPIGPFRDVRGSPDCLITFDG